MAERSDFKSFMASRGVATATHYVPLHSAPAGRRYGRAAGPMPHTDGLSERLLRLPMAFQAPDDLDFVVATAEAYF
jgi:dTDP-4-amino-4,6-dideoxygalactose transaminase